jgi:hypothetical protein
MHYSRIINTGGAPKLTAPAQVTTAHASSFKTFLTLDNLTN